LDIAPCGLAEVHRRSRGAIALMMEAVRNSYTSVYFNETTRRYILESRRLHTCRRQNLKSQIAVNSRNIVKGVGQFLNLSGDTEPPPLPRTLLVQRTPSPKLSRTFLLNTTD
jgi:hypothetical protein